MFYVDVLLTWKDVAVAQNIQLKRDLKIVYFQKTLLLVLTGSTTPSPQKTPVRIPPRAVTSGFLPGGQPDLETALMAKVTVY